MDQRTRVLFVMIFLLPLAVWAQDLQPRDVQTVTGEGFVTLRWSAPSAEVRGYVVYRIDADGSQKRLTQTPLTETFYQDLDVAGGQIYGYTVTAVDAVGQEGLASDRVQVTLSKSGTASSGY